MLALKYQWMAERYLDNIFIEHLWRSLKQKAIYLHEMIDGFRANKIIDEWMRSYNTDL